MARVREKWTLRMGVVARPALSQSTDMSERG